MRLMVVGAGGREHALAWKLAAEPGVDDVLCAPGNVGMRAVATTIAIHWFFSTMLRVPLPRGLLNAIL